MKYYISDTHFFHTKIIQMCSRPYSNCEEMNLDLIKKWNKKVRNEDEIYFLGDFSYKGTLEQSIEILKQLNGKKYFVKGNHDDGEFIDYITKNNLVEWVKDYAEIIDNERRVVLCHYPIEDWNWQYSGSYHLFGHIHNNTRHNYKVFEKRFNVSCEVIGYEPKTLDELIEINKNNKI